MRRYETIFISDPDLSSDDRVQLFEKTKDLISKQDGFLVLFDEWGEKKLAYDIKKKGRGYYVRIDFCGDGALVAEMERSFRIDDRVMKFMTIFLDKEVDLEKIKEEIAREAEAEAEAETAAEVDSDADAEGEIKAEDDDVDASSDAADSDVTEIEKDTEE